MMKKIRIILVASMLLAGCTGTPPKLGVEDGRLTSCPASPNCVSSQAEREDETHYIEPVLAKGPLPEVKTHILKVVDQMPGSRVVKNDNNYIRAEFTSLIFRFVDDVEFYFPQTVSEKITIHVRSASRIGHSDLGVNRKRIEKFRSRFKAMNKKE